MSMEINQHIVTGVYTYLQGLSSNHVRSGGGAKKINASQLGMHCPLALWYNIHNVPVDTKVIGVSDGAKYMMMSIGKRCEDLLVESMSSVGYDVVYQQYYCDYPVVQGKLHVHGRIDGVFRDSDEKLHVLEIKSANGSKFKKLKKAIPHQYNIQMQMYLHYFHEYPLADLDPSYGVFAIVSRDTGEIAFYRQHYDEDSICCALERLVTYYALPVSPVPKEIRHAFAQCAEKFCGYCYYYDRCHTDDVWGDEGEEL